MNNSLGYKPYERYKDSGVSWIGEIPAHWELCPNKYLFHLKKSLVGNRSSEYDLLSLTLRGVIRRDMENPQGKFPAEFDTYQEVHPGDFVFCHFDVEETPRTVGLSEFFGMITGAYTIYSVAADVDPRYLLYFYLFADTDKKLRGLYTGLRNTISKEAFGAFKTPLPSISEQRLIADFLDEKCSKIDGAIRIEENQINLLRELSEIIIQEAVIHGLNPTAAMKDSGVSWIGKIPAHWDVKPLLTEAKVKSQINRPDLQLLSVYLGLGVVKFDDVEEKRTNATSLDLSSYQVVNPGDLVLNNQQAWRGSVGVSFETGIVSPAYIVLDLSARFNSEFANYYFRAGTTVMNYLLNSKGVGTIQRNLYWPKLKRSLLTIPPYEEQIAIVEHIKTKNTKIESNIAIKEKEIDRLKEYKANLIEAAVTGKIKVN